MRFLRLLDNTKVRGYALIAAIVASLLGSILAINIFPPMVRQASAVLLCLGVATALFVVYAPLIEGWLISKRRSAATLKWDKDRADITVNDHVNLFWTYPVLNPEVAEWVAHNCTGKVTVQPIKSGMARPDFNTLHFTQANDALHFKMVYWK
ncbi:MAG: hypothetical protein EOP83_06900 [Verrucomicrobiaceae bacterium]|nr:MAG: hypothetical protein EOP83_06900 [Verrucomicrobiaceae bacterium]